jgi:pentatricopeptide repeat protein
VDEARAVVEDMKAGRGGAPAPDVWTYTALVDGYARAGRADDAHALLEEMAAAAQGDPALAPGIVAYKALDKAEKNAASAAQALVVAYKKLLEQSETAEQGRQVLSAMRMAGVEADQETEETYRKLLGQGGGRAVTTDDASPIHGVTAKPDLPPRPQSSLR